MRKPHTLTKTRGNDTPYNWIFFDCETEPEQLTPTKTINRLKLGVVRYYRLSKDKTLRFQRESIFRTSEELARFIDGVAHAKISIMLVSHNLSFDLLAGKVFYSFPDCGYRLQSFYKKGMTAIFRYTKDDINITAIDSGNFFATSLEAIGKMVNRPKLIADFDSITDDDLISYCRNDVVIMVDAFDYWLKFLKENKLGSFKLTIAATAMNVFRSKFMKYDMYLHSDKDTLDLERRSYHGGRVETFYVGYFNSQTYYQLDVNSMYPYVCAENKYPVKNIPCEAKPTLARLESKLSKYAVIADVTIETNEPAYPYLYNGRIFYPIGQFKTTLTTPELIYALEHNHITNVQKMAIYQQFKIFDDYMEFFYSRRIKYRTEGNDIFDKICKLLGNSLYGKWGAKDIKQERVGDNHTGKIDIEPDYNLDTGVKYEWWYFPDSIFKVWQEDVAYNAFPAIAAHVTANGRMMLYGFVNQAKRINTYYSDTDSLWVNQQGFTNLYDCIEDDKLGALKIEDTSQFVEILSPKSYRSEHKEKSKGIRKSAIKLDNNVYQQAKFSSLNGMMRNNTLDGVFIEQTVKHNYNYIFSGYPTQSGQVLPPLAVLQSDGSPLIQGLTQSGFHYVPLQYQSDV